MNEIWIVRITHENSMGHPKQEPQIKEFTNEDDARRYYETKLKEVLHEGSLSMDLYLETKAILRHHHTERDKDGTPRTNEFSQIVQC